MKLNTSRSHLSVAVCERRFRQIQGKSNPLGSLPFWPAWFIFFTLATGMTHFCQDFHGKKGWKEGCLWKNFGVSTGCTHQDKTQKSGEYDSVYSIE